MRLDASLALATPALVDPNALLLEVMQASKLPSATVKTRLTRPSWQHSILGQLPDEGPWTRSNEILDRSAIAPPFFAEWLLHTLFAYIGHKLEGFRRTWPLHVGSCLASFGLRPWRLLPILHHKLRHAVPTGWLFTARCLKLKIIGYSKANLKTICFLQSSSQSDPALN